MIKNKNSCNIWIAGIVSTLIITFSFIVCGSIINQEPPKQQTFIGEIVVIEQHYTSGAENGVSLYLQNSNGTLHKFRTYDFNGEVANRILLHKNVTIVAYYDRSIDIEDIKIN